ncbi:hypothetical protein AYO41_02020 [Verrucomicrobia bacterium SCGC AG-212-E04]|nr:hypothetical protein AYO41_02020 [Verrucomicrobia bacterium SCGC AG-212-E04]
MSNRFFSSDQVRSPRLGFGSTSTRAILALMALLPGVVSGASVETVALSGVAVGRPQLVELRMPFGVPADEAEINISCDCVRLLPTGNEKAALRSLMLVPEQAGTLKIEVRINHRGILQKSVIYSAVVTDPGAAALISAAVAVAERGTELVDVRTEPAFRRLHAAGALSVPLPMFATRSSLADRAVILIGDGFDEAALVAAVRRLPAERKGTVRIIRGGLAAWVAARGGVEGTEPYQRPNSVGPVEAAMALRNGTNWVVVMPATAAAPTGAAGVEIVRFTGDKRAFLENVRVASARTGTFPQILLAEGLSPTLLEGTAFTPFVLSGPLPAFISLAHPAQSARAAIVANDPVFRGRPSGSGGCGSCPGR